MPIQLDDAPLRGPGAGQAADFRPRDTGYGPLQSTALPLALGVGANCGLELVAKLPKAIFYENGLNRLSAFAASTFWGVCQGTSQLFQGSICTTSQGWGSREEALDFESVGAFRQMLRDRAVQDIDFNATLIIKVGVSATGVYKNPQLKARLVYQCGRKNS